MTYGQLIDDAGAAIQAASKLASRTRAKGHPQVAAALANRDRLLHSIVRLVRLLEPAQRKAAGAGLHPSAALSQVLARARITVGEQQPTPSRFAEALRTVKLDDAHEKLRALAEQLRLVGDRRVQIAARVVVYHAHAVRIQGEVGSDPRESRFPNKAPIDRLNDAL
jgi:hypothetical protein